MFRHFVRYTFRLGMDSCDLRYYQLDNSYLGCIIQLVGLRLASSNIQQGTLCRMTDQSHWRRYQHRMGTACGCQLCMRSPSDTRRLEAWEIQMCPSGKIIQRRKLC
jgi:hypothetical protein